MVKDASTSTEVAVLVDGCRMPVLEDKDSGPRDWGGLAWDHSAREVAAVVSCPNQHQRLIATTTNDYFEILLKNHKRWTYGDGDHAKAALRFVTYVDGHIMEKLLVDPGDESVIEGQDVSSDKRSEKRRLGCFWAEPPLVWEDPGVEGDGLADAAGRDKSTRYEMR